MIALHFEGLLTRDSGILLCFGVATNSVQQNVNREAHYSSAEWTSLRSPHSLPFPLLTQLLCMTPPAAAPGAPICQFPGPEYLYQSLML